MSAAYGSVSVEGDSLTLVTASLERCLGEKFSSEQFLHVAGVEILILEIGAEADYTHRFLLENGLEMAPPWDKLDSRLFKVEVQLSSTLTGIGGAWVDVMAAAIGRHVSDELATRVVMSLDSGSIPFRVYERGKIIEDFAAESAAYFASREWVPRSRSSQP